MENSLILAFIPHSYSHHKSLAFAKERAEPPESLEIAAALTKLGLDATAVARMLERARVRATITATAIAQKKIRAVTYWSTEYPGGLRDLPYPPWNLFFIGELPSRRPTLAIVGTRKPNRYGYEVLAATIPFLRTRPMQIVSGLARGIDALAHAEACESEIPNFAVLGTGVDVIYPEGHERLAARILDAGGGLLSEFPPGTPPFARNFPWRNRIISGLADVVWIAQGTPRSGSLHTAAHALDQGKSVAVTPGDVFSELSALPNRLLAEGAHPVLRAEDLDGLLAKRPAGVAH
jgi:DNA processing protein